MAWGSNQLPGGPRSALRRWNDWVFLSANHPPLPAAGRRQQSPRVQGRWPWSHNQEVSHGHTGGTMSQWGPQCCTYIRRLRYSNIWNTDAVGTSMSWDIDERGQRRRQDTDTDKTSTRPTHIHRNDSGTAHVLTQLRHWSRQYRGTAGTPRDWDMDKDRKVAQDIKAEGTYTWSWFRWAWDTSMVGTWTPKGYRCCQDANTHGTLDHKHMDTAETGTQVWPTKDVQLPDIKTPLLYMGREGKMNYKVGLYESNNVHD